MNKWLSENMNKSKRKENYKMMANFVKHNRELIYKKIA